MNTKCMILALNSLMLFNTVSPGFGISSFRKKIVNTCAKLGKKSIFVLCGMALLILSTFGLKGAYFSSKLTRGAQMASHNSRSLQGPQFGTSVQRSQIPPHDPGPFHDPAQEQLRARASAALTSQLQRAVPISAAFAASAACSKWDFPTVPFPGREQHVPEEDSEEEISSDDEQVHVFPTELCGSCETTPEGIVVHYPGKQNLLEQLPIELVHLITQMIHHKRWVHARSFQHQWFYRDDTLAQGEDPKEWPDSKKNTSINFIDGDPHKLELAFSSYKLHPGGQLFHYLHGNYVPTVDAITIDTDIYSQTIEKGKEVDINYREFPTSYHQRGIHALRRTSSQKKPESFIEKTRPGFVPLRQQVNFIDHQNVHMLEWNWDNSSHTTSLGPTTYGRSNYAETYGEDLMKLGIQRKLLKEKKARKGREEIEGKVIWFRTIGNKVGIYEKALSWYDKDAVFKDPVFKSVLKDSESDSDGDKFNLVQVIEEPTTIRTVSLPHTPVYLRDKDGKEIENWCTLPPVDSTAHLKTELEYPENLETFALGFSAEETDTRASLYKQLGDNPSEYNPRLLLDQVSSTKPSPDKMEMLYPNENASVKDYFRYASISAQVYVATKLGRRKPRQLTLP